MSESLRLALWTGAIQRGSVIFSCVFYFQFFCCLFLFMERFFPSIPRVKKRLSVSRVPLWGGSAVIHWHQAEVASCCSGHSVVGRAVLPSLVLSLLPGFKSEALFSDFCSQLWRSFFSVTKWEFWLRNDSPRRSTAPWFEVRPFAGHGLALPHHEGWLHTQLGSWRRLTCFPWHGDCCRPAVFPGLISTWITLRSLFKPEAVEILSVLGSWIPPWLIELLFTVWKDLWNSTSSLSGYCSEKTATLAAWVISYLGLVWLSCIIS